MRVQQQWWSVLVAAMLVGLGGVTVVAAAGEQFIPILSTRQGAQRFVGIPQANGFIDYLTLLNARDGGINGVPLVWEDCDTVYDVDRSVECYERLKAKGPTGAAVFHPPGTHVVYALTERATHDHIPLLSMGFGRTDASDGRVFPYVFNPPINYQDILTYVYGRGKGPGPEGDVGTDRWNLGVLDAVLATEGIRRAMREFGHQPLTGAQVQWGLDHLTLTPAYINPRSRGLNVPTVFLG